MSTDSNSKPSEDQPTPQAAPELPDIQLKHSSSIEPTAPAPNQVKLELPRVLDLSCGILARLILQAPKEKSKALFKRLKADETIALGNITIGEKAKIKLSVMLDHREFVGAGFNNDVFRASLDQLIKKIAPRLRAKQELNIRTDNQGSVLFDIPAGVRVKGQLNVMMFVLDLKTPGSIVVRLSYFEPSQFMVKE